MIAAIVAVDNDWGIGANGDLLEHIPEDLKYFKELTQNHIVVMGRKTWDSLPKKPLPDRLNLIVSSQPKAVIDSMSVRLSMSEVKSRLSAGEDDWFIIGGGQIYKELLPYCDRAYVTKIFNNHEGVDTYFPNLDESAEWSLTSYSTIYDYKDLQYQFCQYERI